MSSLRSCPKMSETSQAAELSELERVDAVCRNVLSRNYEWRVLRSDYGATVQCAPCCTPKESRWAPVLESV